MITIDVNIPIAPESENKWMAMFGEEQAFFSLETIKRIFRENPNEKDFKFNFNCDGGYVDEGFAIYDYIRTSGKNIHCNIEGGCHSMAIIMLLAAPKENRTANQHATALIHCVHADFYGSMNPDELREAADELEKSQERILDVYAERTGTDIRILRTFMKEEKMRDTDFLLKYGFIGKVNSYNTNQREAARLSLLTNPNTKDMAKKNVNDLLAMANNVAKGIKNLLGTAVNYDFADADGNVLFSTEAEDDTLEVGMPATPDGTYELQDGRVVIIADGVITEIQEPVEEEEQEEEVNPLEEENANLRNQLQEALDTINELKAEIQSNYKPANVKRTDSVKKPAANAEDHKEEVRAKLGLKK